GWMSVEVHEGALLKTLWSSTSRITNRATWMHDRLDTLGNRQLNRLVLPASHDAAMYHGGWKLTSTSAKPLSLPFAILGKTQSLSIYGQLMAGVRYFDLRPRWMRGRFVLYHGPISGPDLGEVLRDINRFASEAHYELVILKFSHFDNIDKWAYRKLVEQVSASLDEWLVKSKPRDSHLAEMALGDYVAAGPAIVADVDYHC